MPLWGHNSAKNLIGINNLGKKGFIYNKNFEYATINSKTLTTLF